MESMTTSELLEFALMLRDDMEEQFEFWLSITFAVIVSSFFGRTRISPSWRVVIGCLYLLSTALFTVRYVMSSKNFQIYIEEALVRGAKWIDAASTMYGLRVTILIVGTLSTVWFLYADSKSRARDT